MEPRSATCRASARVLLSLLLAADLTPMSLCFSVHLVSTTHATRALWPSARSPSPCARPAPTIKHLPHAAPAPLRPRVSSPHFLPGPRGVFLPRVVGRRKRKPRLHGGRTGQGAVARKKSGGSPGFLVWGVREAGHGKEGGGHGRARLRGPRGTLGVVPRPVTCFPAVISLQPHEPALLYACEPNHSKKRWSLLPRRGRGDRAPGPWWAIRMPQLERRLARSAVDI